MNFNTHATKARTWPQKHRSDNVTWKVQVGKKNDGKADIRSFATKPEARIFHDDWNAKLATGNPNGLADLSTLYYGTEPARLPIRADVH